MDRLAFDLASEVDSAQISPFVSKSWLSVIDDNAGQYASGQVSISTGQFSNSNAFLNYSEAFLQVPMLLTVTTDAVTGFAPAADATAAGYGIGLKNWFGTMIHSMSISYNGTVVVQAQPMQSVINSFRLATTLSYSCVEKMGSTYGLAFDDPLAFSYQPVAGSTQGQGVCNNLNLAHSSPAVIGSSTNFGSYTAFTGSDALRKRQSYINFDPDAGGSLAYSRFQTADVCNQLYKSHVYTKINAADGVTRGVFQIAISATIMLKHLSPFFSALPMLKGAFIQMTLLLNNTTMVLTKDAAAVGANAGLETAAALTRHLKVISVNNSVGGLNPMMCASSADSNGGACFNVVREAAQVITASICVGARCIEPTQSTIAGVTSHGIGTSITLNVPSYKMQSVIEQSYLSDPIRSCVYLDHYHFVVPNIANGSTFQSLLSNGISHMKRVTIFPVLSTASAASTQLPNGLACTSSPFDPCLTSGFGSPLLAIGQLQIVVAGANVLANQHRYGYEHWMQEMQGFGVNGGLTDGVCSGLFSQQGWEMAPVYSVDLSRMLPAERILPKSISITGINSSQLQVDYVCVVEYEQTAFKVDVLSGAKV
jgi:hypothetical protein